MGKTWVITHVATGQRVGCGDRIKANAIARRKILFSILPDWTAPDLATLARDAGCKDSVAFGRMIMDSGVYKESI